MNKSSALAKVESLSRRIAKSETSLEAWKWQRAEAMAEAADAGATVREIATAAGFAVDKKGDSNSVRANIKTFRMYPAEPRPSYPDAYDAVTGFDREAAQVRTDTARAKKVLTEAPLEQVERLISELPADRQQAVAAASGNAYAKARQDYDEAEAQLTQSEHKEREAHRQTLDTFAGGLVAPMKVLGIADHINQAREDLAELVADNSVTPQLLDEIVSANAEWQDELTVAAAMAGLEVQS